MSGAEATSEEIRRLIEDEGLTAAEVAERMSVPESVVAAWLERNDVEEQPTGDSNAEAESDFPGAGDGEVFRCSECGDVVRVKEKERHDERCPPEVDWRRAGR